MTRNDLPTSHTCQQDILEAAGQREIRRSKPEGPMSKKMEQIPSKCSTDLYRLTEQTEQTQEERHPEP